MAMIPYFRKLFKLISSTLLLKRDPEPAIYYQNLNRIVLMLFILPILHFAHIVVFALALTTEGADPSGTTYLWRLGIIYAHVTMLILITILGFTAL